MNVNIDTVYKESETLDINQLAPPNFGLNHCPKTIDTHAEIFSFLTSIKPHCKNNLSVRLEETYNKIVENQLEYEKIKYENQNFKICSAEMERKIFILEKEFRNLKCNNDDLTTQLELSEQLRVKLDEKVKMIKKQADKSLMILVADNKKIREEISQIREENTLLTD